jgi:hypothetical protein
MLAQREFTNPRYALVRLFLQKNCLKGRILLGRKSRNSLPCQLGDSYSSHRDDRICFSHGSLLHPAFKEPNEFARKV